MFSFRVHVEQILLRVCDCTDLGLVPSFMLQSASNSGISYFNVIQLRKKSWWPPATRIDFKNLWFFSQNIQGQLEKPMELHRFFLRVFYVFSGGESPKIRPFFCQNAPGENPKAPATDHRKLFLDPGRHASWTDLRSRCGRWGGTAIDQNGHFMGKSHVFFYFSPIGQVFTIYIFLPIRTWNKNSVGFLEGGGPSSNFDMVMDVMDNHHFKGVNHRTSNFPLQSSKITGKYSATGV